MTRTAKFTFFVFALLIMGSFLTSCSTKEDMMVNVYLMNTSKETVNLWLGHDKTPPAGSLVTNGNMIMFPTEVTTVKNTSQFYLQDTFKVNVQPEGKDLINDTLSNGDMIITSGMSIFIKWDGTEFTLSDQSN